MLRIFCGYDPREAVGFHAFVESVTRNCKSPVSITPIYGDQRDGTNQFTYSRFLVPYFCRFNGQALWLDGADMLCLGDLNDLPAPELGMALSVVKHEYTTRHHKKYIGTELEAVNNDYERKNWSSLIYWDCGHYLNRILTPLFISEREGSFLHRFKWLNDDRIGELDPTWNWLADEYGENHEAKILHWTAGIPGMYHYRNSPHAERWRSSVRSMMKGLDDSARLT